MGRLFEDYIISKFTGLRYFVELDHEDSYYYASIWEGKKYKYFIFLKDPILEFVFDVEKNPIEEISLRILKYEKVLKDQMNLENWDKEVAIWMFPELLEKQREEEKRFRYGRNVDPEIYIMGERVK